MKKVLIAAACCLVSAVSMAEDKLSGSDIAKLKLTKSISDIGCDSFEKFGYVKLGEKPISSGESIFKSKKLYDNSTLTCIVETADAIGDNYIIKRENAVVDGVSTYIYHSDGSGRVGDDGDEKSTWHTICMSDLMTDESTCAIRNQGLTIAKNKNRYLVFVGEEVVPNSTSLIRIDKSKPSESGANGTISGTDADNIIREIGNSKEISIRFNEVGKRTSTDQKIDAGKFKAAKFILDKIYNEHI